MGGNLARTASVPSRQGCDRWSRPTDRKGPRFMKRYFVSPWIAVMAALLLAGSVHAAPPPWNYNWTPSVTTVHTDTAPATSFLTLTDQKVNNQAQTFSTDITATNITVTSNAPA